VPIVGAPRDEASPAVFGVFDGLTSVIGVLVALGAAHPAVVMSAVLGLAAASTMSMAAGEWLSSSDRAIRPALVMGAATLVGTILPAVGFMVLGHGAALVVAGGVSLLLCAGIAWYRSRFEPPVRAWAETFGIFAVAVAVTYLVALATGAA